MLPIFCGAEIIVVGFRERIVFGSGFVADAPHLHSVGDKSAHQFFHISEIATAIATHINNQSAATCQICQHSIQITFTDTGRKVAIIHITHIVAQNLIFDTTGAFVFKIEIVFVDDAFIIVHGILFPNPISRHIIGRNQIGVSVFQFFEHIAAKVEKFVAINAGSDFGTIAIAHFIPIHIFVFKKGVMLIQNGPKCIEIAFGIIAKSLVAASKASERKQQSAKQANSIMNHSKHYELKKIINCALCIVHYELSIKH